MLICRTLPETLDTVPQIEQVKHEGDVVPMQTEVLIGPLISEIRQSFDDSTQLTTRQARFLPFEVPDDVFLAFAVHAIALY